jgi:glycosyltransferase involved in cell wall biosynthesis
VKLVTVVIPCFNSGVTLPQTVESVKAQSHTNIEIIIVDDGSTDELTIECINGLNGVRIIRQKNCGLPAARNAGFSEARGEYILPLDADDWIEPETLSHLLVALEENPHASFAFTHITLEGEKKGTLKKNYNFFEQLFLNQMPYCLLLRRSVWCEIGGYDETMSRGYEDWEFNIRLGSFGYHGVVVPLPLFHYRVMSTGMLLSRSNKLHAELWREIRIKHASLYSFSSLLELWLQWRNRAATYPLIAYFFWLGIGLALPSKIFNWFFRNLGRLSHSRRESRRSQCVE